MKKIKYWLADDRIFYSILLLVVALTAFGLGRASVSYAPTPPTANGVRMLQQAAPLPAVTSESTAFTERLVASSGGTRYYYMHCSGTERIKDENKIYFDTVKAAEAAGYTLALRCSPQ